MTTAIAAITKVSSTSSAFPLTPSTPNELIISQGCNYNDDDATYLDHGYCSGDSSVCDTYYDEASAGSRGAEEAIDQCGFACEGENANMTWLVPCMWDTIANMDSYCTTG